MQAFILIDPNFVHRLNPKVADEFTETVSLRLLYWRTHYRPFEPTIQKDPNKASLRLLYWWTHYRPVWGYYTEEPTTDQFEATILMDPNTAGLRLLYQRIDYSPFWGYYTDGPTTDLCRGYYTEGPTNNSQWFVLLPLYFMEPKDGWQFLKQPVWSYYTEGPTTAKFEATILKDPLQSIVRLQYWWTHYSPFEATIQRDEQCGKPYMKPVWG